MLEFTISVLLILISLGILVTAIYELTESYGRAMDYEVARVKAGTTAFLMNILSHDGRWSGMGNLTTDCIFDRGEIVCPYGDGVGREKVVSDGGPYGYGLGEYCV